MNNEEIQKLLESVRETRRAFVETIEKLKGKRILVLTHLLVEGTDAFPEVFGKLVGLVQDVYAFDGGVCLVRIKTETGIADVKIEYSSEVYIID